MQLGLNGPQLWAVDKLQRGNTIWMPWGRGVGKSWFLRAAMWLLVAQYDHKLRSEALKPFRGIRIIVLMPTLKQFKDVHGAQILDELENEWGWLGGKVDRTTWTITFPGGSWIKPFPAAEYSSRTARGMRADVIVTDESDDIDPGVFDSVAFPWFSEPWSLQIRVGGGTPRRGRYGLLYRNHLLGASNDPEDARYHSLHAIWSDAPETVSDEAVKDAERTTPRSIFRREWLCDFDSAEGLVYGDVFDANFHVRKPPENTVWTDILIGCDHGWEHPGVMLLIGVTGKGKDATAWVLREIYAQRQSDAWWKDKLREWVAWYPRHYFYGDPSQPRVLDAYKHECKARIRDCDNSVEEGLRAVADRLVVRERDGERFARLYVDPCCENTIREFGEYRRKRDPRNSDSYLEDVDKRNDDAMDALRYAIFNFFGNSPSGRNERHLEDRQR